MGDSRSKVPRLPQVRPDFPDADAVVDIRVRGAMAPHVVPTFVAGSVEADAADVPLVFGLRPQ